LWLLRRSRVRVPSVTLLLRLQSIDAKVEEGALNRAVW
jgi:hypothetical protein